MALIFGSSIRGIEGDSSINIVAVDIVTSFCHTYYYQILSNFFRLILLRSNSLKQTITRASWTGNKFLSVRWMGFTVVTGRFHSFPTLIVRAAKKTSLLPGLRMLLSRFGAFLAGSYPLWTRSFHSYATIVLTLCTELRLFCCKCDTVTTYFLLCCQFIV